MPSSQQISRRTQTQTNKIEICNLKTEPKNLRETGEINFNGSINMSGPKKDSEDAKHLNLSAVSREQDSRLEPSLRDHMGLLNTVPVLQSIAQKEEKSKDGTNAAEKASATDESKFEETEGQGIMRSAGSNSNRPDPSFARSREGEIQWESSLLPLANAAVKTNCSQNVSHGPNITHLMGSNKSHGEKIRLKNESSSLLGDHFFIGSRSKSTTVAGSTQQQKANSNFQIGRLSSSERKERNRESAARSRKKKKEHTEMLETALLRIEAQAGAIPNVLQRAKDCLIFMNEELELARPGKRQLLAPSFDPLIKDIDRAMTRDQSTKPGLIPVMPFSETKLLLPVRSPNAKAAPKTDK